MAKDREYTEAELSLLTPEEREGVTDPDLVDDDDDKDAVERMPVTDGGLDDLQGTRPQENDDDDEGGAGTPDDKPADKAGDAKPGKEGEASEDKPEGGEADAEGQPQSVDLTRPPMSLLDAKVPENAEARLKEIEAGIDKLNDDYDEGEITSKERRAGEKALTTERDELREALMKARLANEMNTNVTREAWYGDVDAFLAANPEVTKVPLRVRAFDDCLISVNSDPANSKLGNKARIALAAKNWSEAFGIEVNDGTKPKSKVDTPAKPPAKPPAAKTNIPPTLGGIPAANATDVDDGGFGIIDKLLSSSSAKDVAKGERMMEKLSKTERDSYMRMSTAS